MITSKQRAYLRGLANGYETLFQVGKSGVTDTLIKQIEDALKARELIKISVLQNCMEDTRAMAEVLAERTRSQVVQVIGRKIVLYREGKDEKKKIVLPK